MGDPIMASTRSAASPRHASVENISMNDATRPELTVVDISAVTDAADIDATESDDDTVDLVMMELLRRHVPLSLLVDLAYPEGPHSREILAAEAP